MSKKTRRDLKTVAVTSAIFSSTRTGDVRAAAYRAMYAAEEAIKALNSAQSAVESLDRALEAEDE